MNWNFLKMSVMAVCTVLMLNACEKEENNPSLPYDSVFGSWEWIQTTQGLTGVEILADSVDYDQALLIEKDDKYTWSKNDTVTQSLTFKVIQDTVNTSGDAEYYFQFTNDTLPNQSFYIVNQDTLHLSNDCADCDSFIFVRK
ncbi:hypothetical protein [Membranihabitans marinus]|uniref:hypothetical protein n=1 Tax=Membranihabitans marinus TaxID=1227546 RepID=UPI001F29A251|nr:hypothetical protein [Membranihabitans marinus]